MRRRFCKLAAAFFFTISLQDMNNAPSFSLAKTGHWTNLARTLQARDKSRIALRAHQPFIP
jgi:hypothetical protein